MAPARQADDLARSEARYRTIFERMPIAFWEIDSRALRDLFQKLRSEGVTSFADHCAAHPDVAAAMFDKVSVTDVNAETLRIMGATSRDQLLGPLDRMFWSLDDFVRSADARFRGATTISDVSRLGTLDGRKIDVLWTMVFTDEAGAGLNLLGAIDVTERSHAVQELARSEAKYRILFDHVPLPLVQTDASRLLAIFGKLRAEGVEDLGAYIDAHPGFMDQLLDAIIAEEANQPLAELLGAAEKADINGSIARFWKTNPGTVRRSLEARYRGDKGYVEETEVDTLDGRLVDIAYSVAYPPELNQLGMAITALIDITDRKRATEKIRRSETKYRNLFNQTPIALWQLDTRAARILLDQLHVDGVTDLEAYAAAHPDFVAEVMSHLRVTAINDAALRLFGATDRDALRPNLLSLWLDPHDLLAASMARAAGERAYEVETRIRTMDGRTVDIWVSVAFGADSDPHLNLVGAIDISDRKRASEEVRRSELKYRNLFNQTPIALWQFDSRDARPELDAINRSGITDVDAWLAANPDFFPAILSKLKVTEINDAALALFDAPDRETLRPRMVPLWLHGRDLLHAAAARLGGARSFQVETCMKTLDGRPLDILATIYFGDPADPEALNLVGAIDISGRKRAEEMLRKVQAEFAHAARVATLGELTASIAHEVNQPLAAIATNGEASLRWLAREEPDLEEVRTLAARMVADARRAADVIARIRTMATGKAPEQVAMSINEAAEDATAFLRHEFELHHVALRLELVPGLPMVRADRTQLQQVLVNLAMNAMQAMEQHGTARPAVTVRTSPAPEGGVLVEIEDNGPGIPDDQVGRLFDSFFTTKEGGLGIGLSICRSIVEAHGGRIGCANLPTGARFSFTLPAASSAWFNAG